MINPWTLPLLGLCWMAAGFQHDGPMVILAALVAPIFVSAARQDYQTMPYPLAKIG